MNKEKKREERTTIKFQGELLGAWVHELNAIKYNMSYSVHVGN